MFGQDRQLRDSPQLCSRCDVKIADEDVPLILFGPDGMLKDDGDILAWVFCDGCTRVVLSHATRRARTG